MHARAYRTRFVVFAFVVLAAGCDRPSDTPMSVGAGGLRAPNAMLTEDFLTEHSDAVVDATVLSRDVLRYADDPFLPDDRTPLFDSLVRGGAREAKWHVRVTETRKGSPPSPLWIQMPLRGRSVSTGGLACATCLDRLGVGETYRFYLLANPPFGSRHFFLGLAKDVATGEILD